GSVGEAVVAAAARAGAVDGEIAMPWELILQHHNGPRLGRAKEEQAKLSRLWPRLEWHVDLPAPPRTVGMLEAEGFSFELYGLDVDPVEDCYLDGHGNRAPTPP